MIKADGASEMMFVEMNRLVGGLKVNVVNQSEFNNIRVRLDASCYDSEQILLGDYTFIPLMSHSWEEFEVGEDIYLFPSKGAVFGEVVVYDEYWNEYCFDFEAKNSIQRNKKLELNLTLTKAAPHGRSIDVVNSVICEEKVLEL